jgi:DNA repair exonuclease SbcCD nuclease subunit
MIFIHAADIHLDSAAAGAARGEHLPARITHHCTRRAFENLITLARDEDAAFLVIAGDIFDSDWEDFSTGLYFSQQMLRLGRPCFVIRGNHDAESVITRKLTLPPNVREFSPRMAQTLPLDEFGVALHGRSFPNRAVPEDISDGYPAPVPGKLNIGLLHTSADDASGRHARYAPCSPGALSAKGYDYWALGHVHERRTVASTPWIVFPGNLQGRHPNETGAKGAMLVRFEDGHIVGEPEFRALDVLRWAAIEVALDGAENMTDLQDRAARALQSAAGDADGRPTIARVTLTGETALHPELLTDPEVVEAECRAAAFTTGTEIYVDAVRMRTRPLRAMNGEALDALHSAFQAALNDADLTTELAADLRILAKLLPHGIETNELTDLHALAGDAWQIVSRALSGVQRT